MRRRWFFHERQIFDVIRGKWKWYCVCGEQSKRKFGSMQQAQQDCETHRVSHPVSQPATP